MKPQLKSTIRKARCRIAHFLVLAGILFLGFCNELGAQKIAAKSQVKAQAQVSKRVVIVKGGGIEPSQPGKENAGQTPVAPAALSLAERRNLIAQALDENQVVLPFRRLTPYVTLSPRVTYVEEKGFLNFHAAKAIITLNNTASFERSGNFGRVGLNLGIENDGIDQRLYVDCRVFARTDDPFEIIGPFGRWEQQDWQGHLQFIFSAEDDYVYEFYITHNGQWWAYSCEVSRIT